MRLKLFVSNNSDITRLTFDFDMTLSADADDFIRAFAFDGLSYISWSYGPHDLIANLAHLNLYIEAMIVIRLLIL